ncbi:MAG TPA: hypothetical protein PK566_02590 [Pseudobacteroides sp.]|nr:hypothetical protein [Pseudobacteroides sp.]
MSRECFIDIAKEDGWRRVRSEDSNTIIYLPQGTRVRLYAESDERDYFTILEGKYKTKHASVKKKSFFNMMYGSYLTSRNRTLPKAELKFYKSKKKLEVNGETYNAFSGSGGYDNVSSEGAIPSGKYYLEMPDEPHSRNGNTYKDQTKYATSWFRITYLDGGYVDDRYLHTGMVSAGCITVVDIKRWTEIYEYLIFRRVSFDGFGRVGIIEVFD